MAKALFYAMLFTGIIVGTAKLTPWPPLILIIGIPAALVLVVLAVASLEE